MVVVASFLAANCVAAPALATSVWMHDSGLAPPTAAAAAVSAAAAAAGAGDGDGG